MRPVYIVSGIIHYVSSYCLAIDASLHFYALLFAVWVIGIKQFTAVRQNYSGYLPQRVINIVMGKALIVYIFGFALDLPAFCVSYVLRVVGITNTAKRANAVLAIIVSIGRG